MWIASHSANVRNDGKGKVASQKTMELCGIAILSSLRDSANAESWQSIKKH